MDCFFGAAGRRHRAVHQLGLPEEVIDDGRSASDTNTTAVVVGLLDVRLLGLDLSLCLCVPESHFSAGRRRAARAAASGRGVSAQYGRRMSWW